MIGLGGGVAWLYIKSPVTLTPLLAVNVGGAAPLISGQFVAQTPELLPGESTSTNANGGNGRWRAAVASGRAHAWEGPLNARTLDVVLWAR
jgi:hypothetical protein